MYKCICIVLYVGAVRASSIFPIMSVGLLFLGGLCVAASEFYRSRHNVILSAGIFFVSAGVYAVCVFLFQKEFVFIKSWLESM